jgi:MoaA/NifB/PqqE/SkfB family radical SAM enzyme
MSLEEHICPAPWLHACINTNGRLKLCCNSNTTPQEYRFYENFNEYWNSDYLNNLRGELKTAQRPEMCNSCWKKEAQGVQSLRNSMINTLKDHGDWDSFVAHVENNTVPSTPIELDLKLGNYCNLTCRMCSSYSSSSYATEFKKIYGDTGIDYGQNADEKNYVQSKWYNDERFETLLKKMIDDGLQKIKFTGGEPMMVPGCKRFIEYCIHTNKAKDIELALITNGTLINDEWIDLIQQFKHTSLILSIDGVGNTFEYIRHPAKWDDMVKVFKKLDKFKQTKMMTFCLQALNVLEPARVLDLALEYSIMPSLITLDTPNYMDVLHIPNELRNDATESLKKSLPYYTFRQANGRVRSRCEAFFHSALNKIEKCKYNKQMSDRFVEINRLKDKYKNQSWDSFELAKYYG